jgi:hypothetical protein
MIAPIVLPPPGPAPAPAPAPAAEDVKMTNVEDKEEDEEVQVQVQVQVQVLSPHEAEREFRRKRRRKLVRLLKRPDAPPSFLAVLQAEPKAMGDVVSDDSDDDDDDYEIPPPRVVIDVDAYLGFKAKSATTPLPPVTPYSSYSSWSSIVPSSVPSSSDSAILSPSRLRTSPPLVPSSTTQTQTQTQTPFTAPTTTTTPADEGWYEGSRSMAMPEDSTFLSEMHVWIRQHMEFFSASTLDVRQSQMGRRTKTVHGKVGIRCIHCARALLPQMQKGIKVSWPTGAVAYPSDFMGVYSGVSQKPQLHFESCPYLPQDSTLATMIRASKGNSRQGSGIGKRKRMVQGVSGLMYYVISCQRIGLRELGDGVGMRFTRELTLEPLDFESIRIQVERERPDLIPRQYQPKMLTSMTTTGSTSMSTSIGGTPDPATSSSTAAAAAAAAALPIHSDATTQAVLQQALESISDNDPHHNRLIRRSDKSLLSDYMFLAISQMAICHASPQDFAARGKKTKLMRLGLAGFCCRHCQFANQSVFSCRSYSSAPDNLASAISNSFVLHLQKCPYTPPAIKTALATAKKIHSRQMALLPYGSQRKMFMEMWVRLRASDKSSAPEDEDDKQQGSKNAQEGDEEWNPESEPHIDDQDIGEEDSMSFKKDPPTTVIPSTTLDPNRPNARGGNFPVSNDPSTQAALKKVENSWDTAVNDHLILPEDRYLVSDYVFLTMRQLKIAVPTPSDFRGNRRNNVLSRMPGLGCIHCAHDPAFHTPAGRSFPSAPDNMASALNSSFYNHMQQCPHLDASLKHALVHLRKIHSQQCSSMTFGSQRRFFNKVYDKLKQIPLTKEQLASFNSIGATPKESTTSNTSDKQDPILDSKVFRDHSFVEAGTVGIPFWQCLQCRMVPFEFRTVGAVHYVRPLVQHLKQHKSICPGDGISLGWVNAAVRELCEHYKSDKLDDAIRPLIEIVVGNDPDLTRLFLGCVATRGKSQTPLPETETTSGWWRRLPHSVDVSSLQTAFETFATKLELPSARLMDHPKILRALEIMSPCLQVDSAAANSDLEPPVSSDPSPKAPSLPAPIDATPMDTSDTPAERSGNGNGAVSATDQTASLGFSSLKTPSPAPVNEAPMKTSDAPAERSVSAVPATNLKPFPDPSLKAPLPVPVDDAPVETPGVPVERSASAVPATDLKPSSDPSLMAPLPAPVDDAPMERSDVPVERPSSDITATDPKLSPDPSHKAPLPAPVHDAPMETSDVTMERSASTIPATDPKPSPDSSRNDKQQQQQQQHSVPKSSTV